MNQLDLPSLYQRLRDARVVRSQYDFSQLCRRGRSYVSALKSRGRNPSLGALASLAQGLGERGRTADTETERESCLLASSLIQFEVYQRVMSNDAPA